MAAPSLASSQDLAINEPGSPEWAIRLMTRALAPNAEENREVAQEINRWLATQSVWSHPSLTLVDSFGSFSQGALWDRKNIVLARTLLDAGAATGNAEWMERGAAALRSAFSALNSATSIDPAANLADRMPMGKLLHRYGGTDGDVIEWNRDFTSNEGEFIGALAWARGQYGNAFRLADGTFVAIDAVRILPSGQVQNALWDQAPPFIRPLDAIIQRHDGIRTTRQNIAGGFGIIRYTTLATPDGPRIVAVPGFTPNPASLNLRNPEFFIGDRWVPAPLGSAGFEAPFDANRFNGRPVVFRVQLNGATVAGPTMRVWHTPPLEPAKGWTRQGPQALQGLPTVFSGGQVWLSSGDDGRGGETVRTTNQIHSAVFRGDFTSLSFRLRGSGSARVELFDVRLGMPVLSLTPAPNEIRTVTWNLGEWLGKDLQIRVIGAQNGYAAISQLVTTPLRAKR
jgi:hypothetical protein